MATLTDNHTERLVTAAGIEVELRRGGRGAPLLVIHSELGVPGWLDAHERLAQSYDVIVPSLPGYGRSTRPDWIMGARDVAAWVTWLARDLGLTAPVNLVGCSMGGWIAAEIATVAPQFIDKMVLVGAMGLKPEEGEIFDYFLESGRTGIARAFHRPDTAPEYARFYGKEWTPEDADRVEQHREMTCRIAWKPYMHSLTLGPLLRGVATPTLIVWGADDAITPLDCGRLYNRVIPGSRLVTIAECGHMPEMEKPSEFVGVVREFVGT
jgi:pimeloyl-ACP methyl ester carboxylesterase